jgi:CheY-like chemotaxis protein
MFEDVLIVEDDPTVRSSLAGILQDEGYRVATAKNGEEALAYLRAHRAPRLILLDLMMPVMDGLTFRAQQLGDPAMARIPTVVLSAARESDKMRGLAFHGYLQKPIELDLLLEVLTQHVLH